MRLRPLSLAAVLLVTVTACGDATVTSSTASTDVSSSSPAATSDSSPGTSASATKPSVSIPSEPPTELKITDLVTGTGPAAATGDTVVLNYVGVRSLDGTEFDSSYDGGQPFSVTLGQGQVIQGWDQGLVGVQKGTRRQLDIPADLAYGDQPRGEIIQANDPLTFVVDVVAVLPATKASDQPQITVEPAANIATAVVTDLVEGDGALAESGSTVVVELIAYRADTGEQLLSSWGQAPVSLPMDSSAVSVPGLLDVLKGMKVGGRRQAQIPAATVFDGAGNGQLGLPEGVDLTVVVDLVAVY